MGTELGARTGGLLIPLAAFVIVVAGMKAAAPLLVPFLLAIFIAILIAPPYQWLQDKGLSGGLALLVVMVVLVVLMLLTGALIGTSLDDFSRALPGYQARLREMTGGLIRWMAGQGLVLSVDTVTQYLDPGKAMKLVSTLLSSMGAMLTNSFLILITVIFLLLEAAGLPDKWRAVSRNAEATLEQFGATTRNINHYMGIKTLASLATGLVIAVWLWIIGVDYPLLWGLLAFLFNYVPNIGSILAAVPAVLLALIQLGVTQALLAAAGYAVVNVVIGTFVEPRFMGRGLGLSTLVVFLSLVFWGWVLGPVGMLLSVPLTIAIKIALDSREETRWMAVMLGTRMAHADAGGEADVESVMEDSVQAAQDTDNA
jgi:predicted PurR-regulated permease PerM